MKGIILAGGTGSRMFPSTLVINKHLLPVYDKPMIYYPLSLLMLLELREIFIVVNGKDLPAFKKLLHNGEPFGINISYVIQEAPLGLAHALMEVEEYAGKSPVCVILGDNIFFGHGLPDLLNACRKRVEAEGGAYIFAYHVPDPQRYGVVKFNSQGMVERLEEKPEQPPSNWAVVGLYFYDGTLWEILRAIRPSARGEYEITSVNQAYLREKRLRAKILGRGFTWFDAGTPESFLEASEFVAVYERRSGKMLACPEEIALAKGWVSPREIWTRSNSFGSGHYARYLKKLVEES